MLFRNHGGGGGGEEGGEARENRSDITRRLNRNVPSFSVLIKFRDHLSFRVLPGENV